MKLKILLFQTRNDFLQLLLDTAEEMSREGKLDVNEKDDITDNYGKDENEQIFKQTLYTKKSKSQNDFNNVFENAEKFFLQ